ncbi:MAG TPA: SRPBCC domain-containing protein [Ktedonobacterales bacterium]|nr:SRPBCC domain-containing protein [Ktedonobacterales bacterium]
MPPIIWEPSGDETLGVTTVVPGCPPVRVFDYWTIPALLCQWWPQHAVVEARVGGGYTLMWPQMDWRLRGRYTIFSPGHSLAFTWAWDHDQADAAPRLVTVEFAPTTTADDADDADDADATEATLGTRLTLTHGPYVGTPSDQELRIEHHLAGWRHFLPALQRAAGG